MASPLRLDPNLIHQAEAEGQLQRRSVPKQIEYWAELGKDVERILSPSDVIAINQGLVKVHLEPVSANPVAPEVVFAELEENRAQGRLTAAPIYYEASRSRPGLLDRVDSNGRRETGHFQNGEFVAIIDS